MKILIITLSFIATLLFNSVWGAEKHKFKTCDQSSFCKRHREHKPYQQDWTLDIESLQVEGLDVVGRLHDAQQPTEQLKIILSLTQNGALRMKIDQWNPTRLRYEAREALNPALSFKKLTYLSKTKDNCQFEFADKRKYKLILNSHPFQAQVLDSHGKIVVLVNSKGLMKYEIHKEVQAVKPELFGAPIQAKAYDEAGREIVNEENGSTEQPDESTTSAPPELEGTAETFGSITDTRPYGPMSVGVDIYFPNSDHVYGVPEHTDGFNLKDTRPNLGDPYRLYNVDIFEYEIDSKMSLYGAIPFVISQSKQVGSFGVFWLNPSETWIDVESNNSHAKSAGVVGMLTSLVSSDKMSGRLTHWFSETGLMDIWFMPGPEPTSVVGYNAEIFGTMPLPPVYSIGFHQCRWNYYSSDEVMEVDEGYDRANIPLDAIWLDIEYTAGRSKKYFTWDSIAFPDPITLAKNLTNKGRRLIAIIDPHIKKESGYEIYEEGTAMDLWTKDATGQNPYEGWCWPGASLWPDFLSAKVRDWWATKFALEHFPGDKNAIVDIWNDMNEPSVFSGPEVSAPRDLRHIDGWEHRDIHNMYGFLQTMSTYEGMAKDRAANNMARPFILTRSLFAGSQRYCSAWTGDNRADWEHLKVTVPMLLSLSISGMPFVGADVTGFFNNPESDELVVRWFQAGAFQPFFRNHAHHDGRRREAYLFQGQTRQLIRNAIQLRYSYGPYWYTLFFEANVNGWPMMRPLWFHEPSDENTYQLEDHYLVGYSILVKPILTKGAISTTIYLPGSAGQTAWFDMNTHTMYQGGSSITVPVDISLVPVFQRAGTIVPRSFRMRRSLELLMKDPYTLDIILGENEGKTYAQGHLFVDDMNKIEPDASSATLIELTYNDEILHVKPSTNAKLGHGRIERIVIYNWPVYKKIESITSKGDLPDGSIVKLNYQLEPSRQDGTASLWIKQPQQDIRWSSWSLQIKVSNTPL